MVKTINDINLREWFGKRKLDYIPVHFLKSSVPLTSDGIAWVEEKTTGRYAVKRAYRSLYGTLHDIYFAQYDIYFEDPKELMLYELAFG